MTYEEFLDTELRGELTGLQYEPELEIVYGTVDTGFIYRGTYYERGAWVALRLDDRTMRKVM